MKKLEGMWWVAGMVGWAHHTAGMEPAAQPHRDLHLCSAVCRRRASRTLTGTVASSPCCLSFVGYPGYTMGTEAPLPTALEEEVSLSINCLYSIFLT